MIQQLILQRNTGIKNDTAGNTGTDTASDTGISSDLKSDTGRNTAGDKIGGLRVSKMIQHGIQQLIHLL